MELRHPPHSKAKEVKNMNKANLTQVVAEKTNFQRKDVEKIVVTLFEVIADAIAYGEGVNIPGFGKFETRPTKAKKGRNPHTGEKVDIPASQKPAFKPAKALKDSVKK